MLRSMRSIGLLMVAAFAAAIMTAPAWAKVIEHPAGAGSLQAVIDGASPGDIIRLATGVHTGPVEIETRVTLEGAPGAILRGGGKGSVITVSAPMASVRGLEIRGSGLNLYDMDSGIFIAQTATGARVENNILIGNLVGIYVHGAANSLIKGNRIVGRREGRTSEAGDGISVWNAPGARVVENSVSYGRDGIFTKTSERNVFRNNTLRNVRFGIHYMYTNDSEVSGNLSIDNNIGYAIMFSQGLHVTENISEGDRDHGLLLNYANGSVITGNVVRGRLLPIERWTAAARVGGTHGLPTERDAASESPSQGTRLGPEKCVFIYNANGNRFTENWFEGCAIGIHFTAGSESNAMSGNAFIRNRNQVKYVGTRYLDWSHDGRGNYWSDNPAFDLDGDGIADKPYRPNGLVDKVLWTAPQAKILVNSPAVQVIRWAQARFPALLPGGVVDSRPLMAPPLDREIEHR
ncbi:nitrous oxide reductase family maturation protein NosD [Aquibium sp. A9E412]|uniref:nitrous oxide reductase family maturation protein NosD n=1 Tax=Aquibium sp. A9E412 TaxID=2976767 RepID=UPI0025B0586A|nr:nitrous oxide reductase family maturation protein NosD [Aquibium sp. A9E412]MDN2565775.1 nitrous oxide reductase family maturation protein NosD [Aquibium sp. A9E412]